MKLRVAIRYLEQYFAPLTVNIQQASPVTMDVELIDPMTKATETLFDIPCRNTMTTPQLYQLINLIETRVKKRNPNLFSAHVVNRLQQS